MNLSGTFWLTTPMSSKLKFPDLYERSPVAIDLGNPPEGPSIPPGDGWATTMACGEEGNDCGIDFDSFEMATIGYYDF